MIHNDVLNQLQLLIKASAPPLVDVARTPLEEPQWVPGQRLTALVLAAMPNGRFQVQIGEQVLDMNLPKNTQPGDQVELTFVANQPRLTFVLTRDLAATAGVFGADKETPVSISDSARFLGALLQKAPPQAGGEAAKLTAMTPLASGAPADTKVLAGVLQNALSQSGLFYESHQAQWVAGSRTLADLFREPQGRIPVNPGNPAGEAVLSRSAPPTSGGAGVQTSSAPLVHPDAAPLVQQQLQALDSRQLVWQGQVWPGQEMEWRVAERDAQQGSADATGEERARWQTQLSLDMPKLGDVQAMLVFVPQGLRIYLRGSAETAERLRGGQGSLIEAMNASGLSVLGVSVEQRE